MHHCKGARAAAVGNRRGHTHIGLAANIPGGDHRITQVQATTTGCRQGKILAHICRAVKLQGIAKRVKTCTRCPDGEIQSGQIAQAIVAAAIGDGNFIGGNNLHPRTCDWLVLAVKHFTRNTADGLLFGQFDGARIDGTAGNPAEALLHARVSRQAEGGAKVADREIDIEAPTGIGYHIEVGTTANLQRHPGEWCIRIQIDHLADIANAAWHGLVGRVQRWGKQQGLSGSQPGIACRALVAAEGGSNIIVTRRQIGDFVTTRRIRHRTSGRGAADCDGYAHQWIAATLGDLTTNDAGALDLVEQQGAHIGDLTVLQIQRHLQIEIAAAGDRQCGAAAAQVGNRKAPLAIGAGGLAHPAQRHRHLCIGQDEVAGGIGHFATQGRIGIGYRWNRFGGQAAQNQRGKIGVRVPTAV